MILGERKTRSWLAEQADVSRAHSLSNKIMNFMQGELDRTCRRLEILAESFCFEGGLLPFSKEGYHPSEVDKKVATIPGSQQSCSA